MAGNKYYVVWTGRKPGIYNNWPEAKRQVDGYSGAKYKGFPSMAEAEAAFSGGATATVKPSSARPTKKATSATPMPHADVAIYCDGACEGNPGPCGTGIAIYRNRELDQLWYGLHRTEGTNNIAELLGLHHAMLLAQAYLVGGQGVIIFSDSQYGIDCITQWAYGWKAKGWTKKGGEIKNLELIQAAHGLYLDLKANITIEHVRGHAGIEGNELADRMAMVAIARQEPELKRFTDNLSVSELLSLARG